MQTETQLFILDLVKVCRKHGLVVAHGQEGIDVHVLDTDEDLSWLFDAMDYTTQGPPYGPVFKTKI